MRTVVSQDPVTSLKNGLVVFIESSPVLTTLPIAVNGAQDTELHPSESFTNHVDTLHK